MKRNLDNVPCSNFRGFISLMSIILISMGGGFLWGTGGAFICLGLVFFVSCLVDEVTERVTLLRRSNEP